MPSPCLHGRGGQRHQHMSQLGHVGTAQPPAPHHAKNHQLTAGAAAGEEDEPEGAERAPVALVLEPARDLAEQTHEALRAFARRLGAPALRTALAVGGGSGKDTLRALEAGVDVVTGTPGARPRTAAAWRRLIQWGSVRGQAFARRCASCVHSLAACMMGSSSSTAASLSAGCF